MNTQNRYNAHVMKDGGKHSPSQKNEAKPSFGNRGQKPRKDVRLGIVDKKIKRLASRFVKIKPPKHPGPAAHNRY